MENSLSYVIFCWSFATAAHQRIIFMVLVKTKLVKNSVKVSEFSLQYSRRKSKNPLFELCEKENKVLYTFQLYVSHYYNYSQDLSSKF